MIPRHQINANNNNNMQDYRKLQIDTLKIFNDNVVELSESEEYCVHFEAGGRNFIITIHLGLHFPNERPKLIISPIVQHSWVNEISGEIEKAPGLLNYSPQHSELGRLVQAIVREYERFPPTIITSMPTVLTSTTTGSPINIPLRPNTINSNSCNGIAVTTTTNSSTSTSSSTTSSSSVSASASSSTQSQSQSQLQSLAKSLDTSPANDNNCANNTNVKLNENNLPNLSTLSLEELKQLDRNPEFFDDFIEELSVVQYLNEDLDSMINQVEIISKENESKESHLVELKRKLSDDVTTLKQLGEKCDELNKKYLKKAEDFAPQHIRELVQIAVSNSDSECDRHVEQFLNGKIDVQTFLNNYTTSKKLCTERKAKEERLGHQLDALERAGGI